jgi:hypothetical protein
MTARLKISVPGALAALYAQRLFDDPEGDILQAKNSQNLHLNTLVTYARRFFT